MSWPTDGKPRYIAVSVTGWPITPKHARRGGNRVPGVSWYVHDRAYCYRIVGSWASEDRVYGLKNGGWRGRIDAQRQAEEFAAELNSEPA